METLMQNSIGDMVDQYQAGGTFIMVLVLVFALLMTFFGYKLEKFFISFIGACIGFFLGFFITLAVNDSPQKMVIAVIIGVAAAAFCAFIAFKLYKIGVFFYAAWSAYSAIYAIIPHTQKDTGRVIAIVAAIIVAVLALIFIKPVLIISSSVSGGLQASTAVFTLLQQTTQPLYIVIAGLAVAVVGIAVQFGITRNKKS